MSVICFRFYSVLIHFLENENRKFHHTQILGGLNTKSSAVAFILHALNLHLPHFPAAWEFFPTTAAEQRGVWLSFRHTCTYMKMRMITAHPHTYAMRSEG
jgi:hypothetical protein